MGTRPRQPLPGCSRGLLTPEPPGPGRTRGAHGEKFGGRESRPLSLCPLECQHLTRTTSHPSSRGRVCRTPGPARSMRPPENEQHDTRGVGSTAPPCLWPCRKASHPSRPFPSVASLCGVTPLGRKVKLGGRREGSRPGCGRCQQAAVQTGRSAQRLPLASAHAAALPARLRNPPTAKQSEQRPSGSLHALSHVYPLRF